MRTLGQLAALAPLVLVLVASQARQWPTTSTAKAEVARPGQSVEADRADLLRRIHLDLTGLPPTPEEMAAFLKDNRPDAYEYQIERLLASPAYGERWAKHWLDAARTAESKDGPPPANFRYRDWVIQALNSDAPIDQFIRERLAGKEPPK